MRNLHLQVADGVVLEVRSLSGALEPTRAGVVPSLDEPASFRIAIDEAETAISPASLSALLTGYTFAYPGAPLADLEVALDDGRVRQSGTLRKSGLPFEIEAELSLDPEGKPRLRAQRIEAGGLPVTRLLDLFDVELDELLRTREERGVSIDGNDLVLDPERLLPPPAIRGRVVAVRVEADAVRLDFGAPRARERPRQARRVAPGAPNFMRFRAGRLRFGKLLMTDTDLEIVDADPGDPFLLYLARYRSQLVAGTSRTTPDLGLVATLPDFDDLDGR